tara:strand:- start:148 stop:759 length:612 start_codon:yes stop_codon:yes gene_type:complete
MVWSHRREFIFIHVPKTGGTTIEQAMKLTGSRNGYGVIKNAAFHHFTAVEVKQLLGDKLFDMYNKVSVVRNPYTRFVSEYYWCQVPNVGFRHNQPFNEFIDYVEKCVKEKNFYETIYHDHFIPQYMYVSNNLSDKKEIIIDNLLRFEDYEKINKYFFENYAVSFENILDIHKTTDDRIILNKNQKKRIYEIYKEDFEVLNYDP